MNETVIERYESEEFYQSKKLVICWNTLERGDFIAKLKHTANKLGFGSYQKDRSGYDINLFNERSKLNMHIQTISSAQWSFWQKVRGMCFDEIIISGYSFKSVSDKASLKELLYLKKQKGNPIFDNALRVFINSSRSEFFKDFDSNVPLEFKNNVDNSLFSNINFPMSLYRFGMEEYFENPVAPTHGEFLMALALEGVHASTESEEAAVKEATIHSEG